MRPTTSPRYAIEAAAMADLEAVRNSNNGINHYHLAARRKGKKPRRKYLTCFNILLFLAMFEATTLIIVGFCSDQLSLHDFYMRSGLQHVVLARLLEDAQNFDDDLVALEDHIVQKAEEQLDNANQDDDEDVWANATPIDDYYSRPHISGRVPLVVGGSDGSGTRAFVDVLAHLSVPMLVDDHGTMDVHGSAMFRQAGWPPLATMILRNTHSANYEMDSLPKDVRNTTMMELGRLHHGFRTRYQNLLTSIQEKNISVATNVTFGFKAPVSMLAVPILNHVNGPMKFLHVVRDGRDVSLSSNQSPVKKFYKDAYSDGEERMALYSSNETNGNETSMEPVMGMQLWNDWNTELFEWERKHADGKNFDFLVMRTEDLLSPEKKFESLVQLAHFVGSPRTMEELCCLSREAVKDMGVSGQPGRRGWRRGMRRPRRDRGDMERRRGMRQPRRDGGGRERRRRHIREMIDLNRKKENYEEESESTGQLDLLKEMTPAEREEYLKGMTDTKRTDLITDIRTQHDEERSLRFKELEKRMAARKAQRRAREDAGHRARHGRGAELAADIVMSSRRRLTQADEEKPARVGKRNARERYPYPRRDKLDWIQKASRAGEQLNLGGRQDNISDRMPHRRDDRRDGRLRDRLRDRGKPPVSVDKRYGKWAKMLEDKPKLSAKLHEEGSKGLAVFGYEPRGRFRDRRTEDDSFVCDERVICEEPAEEEEEEPK